MSTTTFIQMVRAELLRIRRRRSIMAIAAFFTVGVIVIYFGIGAIQHLADPGRYGPAGGVVNFNRATVILSIFFGSLAAILLGTEAGTTDTSSGVFRDIVVTGRERLWLFAVRVPAALIVTMMLCLLALGVSLAAAYGFAGGLPSPGASYAIDSVLWVCAAEALLCVIAVGLGSLTGSRAASLTALIGWQVIAGRLLAMISFLGSARDVIPNIALGALKPGEQLPDTNGLSMSAGLAVAVLAIWLLAWVTAGAWRTRTRDA
ncbi:MAG TPA: hypothetical protein VN740_07390 [Solirubrobacteraceae bacterium]|nr:hypothetical protein [Solirubrobacteraceae bacterium]